MKVFVIGAHSSGKSTLAKYISQKYNLTLLPEVARQILAEQELQIDSLRSNMDLVNDYQMRIFNRQIEQEQKYENFVSDRSILDVLAYSAQHTNILPKLIKDKELNRQIEKLKKSIIFFVRPSKATMKEDGIREHLTWDGIVAIDAMIKLLVQMFEINCIHLNMDSMQERTHLINTIMSMKG